MFFPINALQCIYVLQLSVLYVFQLCTTINIIICYDLVVWIELI